jgi:predicted nucleic acid-binding protein
MDNCCYNRPFDDQTRASIAVETQAKLIIQSLVKMRRLELVWSFVLIYENEMNPHTNKKHTIRSFAKNAAIRVHVSGSITNAAKKHQQNGIKELDALHIACAVSAKADYFITTDKKLLKYRTNAIRIVNPHDFLTIWTKGDNYE